MPSRQLQPSCLKQSSGLWLGENDAAVRYLLALLGHAQLSTTELYTRVSITQLKAVHQRTHPAYRTRAERQQQLASLAAEAPMRG